MKKSILVLLALAVIASATAFCSCDNTSGSAGAGGDVSQEQTGGETGDSKDGSTEDGEQGGTTEGETGGNTSDGEQKNEITGIAFQEADYTYDGEEKCVKVNENDLPNGVSVRYENNVKTDAGEYEAKAVLSGDG